MRRLLPLIAVLSLVSLWGSTPARSADTAPPSTSAVVESTPIKGDVGSRAVIYRQDGVRLGIVVTAHGVRQLVWSRPLVAPPTHLSSPGPAGLVQGIVGSPGSARVQVFAYLVRPSGVASAISGHPSGRIDGAEGAELHGPSFTLLAPDKTHVGSVKYRIQSTYSWTGSVYSLTKSVLAPDYPSGAYPTPNALATTMAGNTVLLRLEVADTEQARDTGLMNRMSLDPDSGMIFVWNAPVLESFWMDNTYIPLSIAFLSPSGEVQQIMDMAPLTTDLHTPDTEYQYAIEANLGFFKSAGIVPGTKLRLNLNQPAG